MKVCNVHEPKLKMHGMRGGVAKKKIYLDKGNELGMVT